MYPPLDKHQPLAPFSTLWSKIAQSTGSVLPKRLWKATRLQGNALIH